MPALVIVVVSSAAAGQICLTSSDMDAPTRGALENTSHHFFEMASKGDVAGLRQSAVPSVASDFAGIENAVKDNQAAFSQSQSTERSQFLLKAEGNEPLPRSEFLCGVFGPKGQTTNSVVFILNNLPPGNYAVVIFDLAANAGPRTLTLVLQQLGGNNDWRLAGFYSKPSQLEGHDASWFATRAAEFKAKGQTHNAWLYYLEARDLTVPVPFMSTLVSDQLYDQMQAVRPADLPPGDLIAAGKTFKITALFPVAVGNEFDVEAKYQAADISNTQKTFEDNMAVIKALVAKYPELHDAFAGVIARAVDPAGKDFGSLLATKDIKK